MNGDLRPRKFLAAPEPAPTGHTPQIVLRFPRSDYQHVRDRAATFHLPITDYIRALVRRDVPIDQEARFIGMLMDW